VERSAVVRLDPSSMTEKEGCSRRRRTPHRIGTYVPRLLTS